MERFSNWRLAWHDTPGIIRMWSGRRRFGIGQHPSDLSTQRRTTYTTGPMIWRDAPRSTTSNGVTTLESICSVLQPCTTTPAPRCGKHALRALWRRQLHSSDLIRIPPASCTKLSARLLQSATQTNRVSRPFYPVRCGEQANWLRTPATQLRLSCVLPHKVRQLAVLARRPLVA